MKEQCVAMLLAGGKGSRLNALTNDKNPRKTRRSIWRQVQNHRFCPQQLRQLGNSSCRCADSIPAAFIKLIYRHRRAMGS